MTNTPEGRSTAQSIADLRKTVHSWMKQTGPGEFRGNGVGVRIQERRIPLFFSRIKVAVRDMTPTVIPDGRDVYTFHALTTSRVFKGKEKVTERIGALRRKRNGILGTWKSGDIPPERDISPDDPIAPLNQPNVSHYINVIEELVQPISHDVTGRTEGERNNDIMHTLHFKNFSAKLLYQAFREGNAQTKTIYSGYRGYSTSYRVPVSATFPAGEVGEIRIRRDSRFGILSEFVVTHIPYPGGEIVEYKIRKIDRRIGVKNPGQKYDRPLTSQESETLLDGLQVLIREE